MAIYRVTVRGWFRDLDDDQRAGLRRRQDDHDLISFPRTYTGEGTLAYETNLLTWAFRLETRTTEEDEEPEALVRERGERMALERVAALGVGHELRVTDVVDMADTWRRR
jgi:hypothetical protein